MSNEDSSTGQKPDETRHEYFQRVGLLTIKDDTTDAPPRVPDPTPKPTPISYTPGPAQAMGAPPGFILGEEGGLATELPGGLKYEQYLKLGLSPEQAKQQLITQAKTQEVQKAEEAKVKVQRKMYGQLTERITEVRQEKGAEFIPVTKEEKLYSRLMGRIQKERPELYQAPPYTQPTPTPKETTPKGVTQIASSSIAEMDMALGRYTKTIWPSREQIGAVKEAQERIEPIMPISLNIPGWQRYKSITEKASEKALALHYGTIAGTSETFREQPATLMITLAAGAGLGATTKYFTPKAAYHIPKFVGKLPKVGFTYTGKSITTKLVSKGLPTAMYGAYAVQTGREAITKPDMFTKGEVIGESLTKLIAFETGFRAGETAVKIPAAWQEVKYSLKTEGRWEKYAPEVKYVKETTGRYHRVRIPQEFERIDFARPERITPKTAGVVRTYVSQYPETVVSGSAAWQYPRPSRDIDILVRDPKQTQLQLFKALQKTEPGRYKLRGSGIALRETGEHAIDIHAIAEQAQHPYAKPYVRVTEPTKISYQRFKGGEQLGRKALGIYSKGGYRRFKDFPDWSTHIKWARETIKRKAAIPGIRGALARFKMKRLPTPKTIKPLKDAPKIKFRGESYYTPPVKRVTPYPKQIRTKYPTPTKAKYPKPQKYQYSPIKLFKPTPYKPLTRIKVPITPYPTKPSRYYAPIKKKKIAPAIPYAPPPKAKPLPPAAPIAKMGKLRLAKPEPPVEITSKRKYKYYPSIVGVELGKYAKKAPKVVGALEIRPIIGRKKNV